MLYKGFKQTRSNIRHSNKVTVNFGQLCFSGLAGSGRLKKVIFIMFLLFNLASYDPPSEIFLVPCPTMTNNLPLQDVGDSDDGAGNEDDDADDEVQLPMLMMMLMMLMMMATPETRQRKLMFLPSSSATEVSTVVCCLTSP